MNNFFWIIVGMIIGWVVEWIIDWLFWRRRGDQHEMTDKLAQLETENRRLESLVKENDQKLARLNTLETDAAACQAKLAEADTSLAQLRTENRRLESLINENGQKLARLNTLESDAAACQAKLAEAEAEITRLQAQLAASKQVDELPTRSAQTSVSLSNLQPPAPPHKDNLEIINGIGPVFAKRLNEAGIFSFDQLAALAPERVRGIIKPSEWQKIEPESWIAQAKSMASSDNLEDILGVGEVYARRLNKAGIYTFAQLAELSAAQIAEIVKAEEWQNIEPESWIAQAKEFIAKTGIGSTKEG